MQAPVFVANWKMHNGPATAREFIAKFLSAYPKHDDRTVMICPSAVALESVAWSLRERPEIRTGVQNISTHVKGAFTGECSASMAKEAGAAMVLVGHSERRHVFGETNEQTSLKCARAFEAGLVPMLCVGETLAQREDGTTEHVVVEQLRTGVATLTPEQLSRMAIAYEPVWAIGTGKNATPADASSVHAVIRAVLIEIVGAPGQDCPILYGGSVNEGNASALLAAPGVAGLLVGGASLDPEAWARICQA